MQPLGMDDPRRIGDYRLLGVLGAGGMGRVYLGRNAGGRTVAVKVIRPDLIGDGEFRMRFRREVTAARRVGGAFTAPVLDADVDANPPWLATGYVAGFSLAEAVEQFGTFTEDAILVLARGLAEAMSAIHGAGVVHRDLKPSNVLLALDGPKVIDFGIARAVEDTALTTTGKVIGSPGFMCPEQVTGEPVVPASDIFALGGVLVFAATGHGPFGTGDTVQMLWRVVYEEPRLDAVPDRLRPLIASCLNKNAGARPTPRQLLDELARIGVPADGGWLPNPVLHEVSRRAVQLLDLDSGPYDIPEQLQTPHGQAGYTQPPAAAPTGQASGPRYPASTPTWVSGDTRGSAPQGWQTPQPGWQQNPVGGQHPPPHMMPQVAQAPKRDRTRIGLIVSLVVIAVVVAVGAFVVGNQLRNDSVDSASSTEPSYAETTDPETTEPSATETSAAESGSPIPDAFLGSWRGTANDGLLGFDIELTIHGGTVGDQAATSSNTGKLVGTKCSRLETVTSVAEDTLHFTAALDTANSGADCVDDGKESSVTLRNDGTLSYSTPGLLGGTISGTLRKTS
ncbi:serine/threonine protein kinase [Nocardia bovistercoris]|uniref:Protein kinase n=1 Tax=Nocardia bovistercoris TaxID=2785916 RepID=A0A931I9D9_9NOCA|nr:serine/threonine-protein kinase [Nocardia bovistercoris]MBH0776491.1 protein kinase [Nocardia bovistercoris]